MRQVAWAHRQVNDTFQTRFFTSCPLDQDFHIHMKELDGTIYKGDISNALVWFLMLKFLLLLSATS